MTTTDHAQVAARAREAVFAAVTQVEPGFVSPDVIAALDRALALERAWVKHDWLEQIAKWEPTWSGNIGYEFQHQRELAQATYQAAVAAVLEAEGFTTPAPKV